MTAHGWIKIENPQTLGAFDSIEVFPESSPAEVEFAIESEGNPLGFRPITDWIATEKPLAVKRVWRAK